ncbi:MAG: hypothetical protein R3Y63_00200 [Eubacteriales bacterium]
MSNKCTDCGFENEEGKLFCGSCGEPLGGDAKLIRDMEKMKEKKEAEEAAKAAAPKDVPLQGKDSSDDDYVPVVRKQKKDTLTPWLIGMILFLFFILCVCGFYVLENFDTLFQ